MPRHRPPKPPAEADRRQAVAEDREAGRASRQLMRESAPSFQQLPSATATPAGRPPVILQYGPRDYSVLTWVRGEAGEPVYRVARAGVKAASTAAVLARKLQG